LLDLRRGEGKRLKSMSQLEWQAGDQALSKLEIGERHKPP
jgi:hypothetical protein